MVPLFNEKHGAGVDDDGLNLSSDEDELRQRTTPAAEGGQRATRAIKEAAA